MDDEASARLSLALHAAVPPALFSILLNSIVTNKLLSQKSVCNAKNVILYGAFIPCTIWLYCLFSLVVRNQH